MVIVRLSLSYEKANRAANAVPVPQRMLDTSGTHCARAMNVWLLCSNMDRIYPFQPGTLWHATSEGRLIEISHSLRYIPEIHASV